MSYTRKSVLLGVPPITKKTKNDLKNDFVPDKELEFLVLPAASATSAARPTVWVGTTAPASPVSGLTGPANYQIVARRAKVLSETATG